MITASFILAVLLLALAVYLERRQRGGPQVGGKDPAFDDDYLTARIRGRRGVHGVLVLMAVIIASAAWVGPGPLWAALWMAVFGLLVLVVFLAMADAFRSRKYLQRKLPELRKQMLGDSAAGGSCSYAPDSEAAEE